MDASRGDDRARRRDDAARRPRIVGGIVLWAIVVVAAWSTFGRHEDGVAGGVAGVLRGVEGHPAAPIALLLAYLVRPITLLPVTVLTAFTGFLLGPVLGFAVATVAVVTTSLIPYAAARGAGAGGDGVRGWRASMAQRPFMSVLAARLAMLPGDLVNVAAGALRVPMGAFVAATAIGGAPGMAIGVLAGASVQGTFRVEGVRVDGALLLASALILVVSVGVSWLLRRRTVALPRSGSPRDEVPRSGAPRKKRPLGRR